MNIHEYQAKEILEEFGAPITKGFVAFQPKEIDEKIKSLSTEKSCLESTNSRRWQRKSWGY